MVLMAPTTITTRIGVLVLVGIMIQHLYWKKC